MEKPPQFIKEFSKEESPEERQQAAREIKAKRAEHFAGKSAQIERQTELQQTTEEREQALAEQLGTIANLKNEVAELSTSGLDRILNYFELRKIRADIAVGQETYEELQNQQGAEAAERQAISDKLESEKKEAQAILADFYKGQKEKWASSEYKKEDITKYFSEEHLASLSLEDYTTLLKRFPKEMVTHVTRQGVRDHTGHLAHTLGAGAYSDNFMRMIEDGRLRSPLGVCLVEDEKEQAIARFLHLDIFEKKEDAVRHLNNVTAAEQGKPGSGDYADRTAIHFATEEVADCYYGSERGNEIFIAYPSAYVASQYYFHGQLNEQHGDDRNDQWVWANEERGMDLNAGIIFIPAEARVDKKTGSQYELDEDLNRIKITKNQTTLRKIIDSADLPDLKRQAAELTGELRRDYLMSPSQYRQELSKRLEPLCQKLEQEFGTIDRRLLFIFFRNLDTFDYIVKDKREEKLKGQSIDRLIENELEEEGILYHKAKDAISSREFWEAYFAKNPAKRPSKIVYYKGTDPTDALWWWRIRQGIDKKAPDKDIGFPERHIKPDDMPKVTAGMGRFRTLSEKVIEDHFAKPE